MKLYEILKGSEYSLDMFSQEVIAELENRIIERIDKKANVIDSIEVFTSLNKWMEERMAYDKDITPDLLKAINHYQDLYITEQINKR